MFLFALTNNKISLNSKSKHLYQQKVGSFYLSVIVDDFLSCAIDNENDFLLFESPNIKNHNNNINFSQINVEKKKKKVILQRPSFTGRPVYYRIKENGDFFCSTHINLLKKSGIEMVENIDVLPEFFMYRYVIPPNTLFKNIFQLSAGEKIYVDYSGSKCKIKKRRYYQFPSNSENIRKKEIYNSIIHKIKESFYNLGLTSNEITVLLSGGLDSSILFSIAQEIYEMDDSYSSGYPFENEKVNIEKHYAESASSFFGTNHYYYEGSISKYLFGLIETINITEEPIHHLQSVMFNLLFREGIPKNKRIIAMGWGADSLFGNSLQYYIHWYQKFKFLTNLKIIRKTLKIIDKRLFKRSIYSFFDKMDKPIQNHQNNIWDLGAYGDLNWVENRFNIHPNLIIKNRKDSISKYNDQSILNKISILELFGETFISQSIISKIAEYNNRIAFYPFTNPDLINYIFMVPWKYKIKEPKHLLKKVAGKLNINKEIVNRKKSGFGTTTNNWARKNGTFKPLIDIVSKDFEINEIRKLQNSDPNDSMILWNIINYSIWKRLHIQNEPVDKLMKELKNNC